MKYLLGNFNSRCNLLRISWSEINCRRLATPSGFFRCHFYTDSVRQSQWLCLPGLPAKQTQLPCFTSTPISSVRNYCRPPKNEPTVEDEKNLSVFQKFKLMYKRYWYVLVPVHIVTSIGWFAGFYYLLKSGVDVVALMERLNFSEVIIKPLRDSGAGYVAASYALYKIATPLRYTVTLGGTTISINYLTKWGLIKPIPPREKLKEMYEEKKENLKERRDQLKEKGEAMMREFRDRGSKNK